MRSKVSAVLLLLAFTSQAYAAAPSSEGALLWAGAAYKTYLNETVRRGLPLIPSLEPLSYSPRWPLLDRQIQNSFDFEETDDARLLKAWILVWNGELSQSVEWYEKAWSGKNFRIMSVLYAGASYLQTLFALKDDLRLQSLWSNWEQKYLSPESLLIGLASFERTDRPAVTRLLREASQLYPRDARFYPFFLLHVADFPQIAALWNSTVESRFSDSSFLTVLRRLENDPANRKLALQVLSKNGSVRPDLTADVSISQDSGAFPPHLSTSNYAWSVRYWNSAAGHSEAETASGVWTWDQDNDGYDDAQIVVDGGKLVSWTQGSGDRKKGYWTAFFEDGTLKVLKEVYQDETWTLRYEAYPFVERLEWNDGPKTIAFDFSPFETQMPFWDPQRQNAPQALWPALFKSPWKPLNASVLVKDAVRVEEWDAQLLLSRYRLWKSQVWLSEADTNRDGKPDTWTYYRNGQIASLYQNFEQGNLANLWEIYQDGQLKQVLIDANRNSKTDVALIPRENIQLWDWKETGTPQLRLFRWDGSNELKVVLFSSQELPLKSMPNWEPRPWP